MTIEEYAEMHPYEIEEDNENGINDNQTTTDN